MLLSILESHPNTPLVFSYYNTATYPLFIIIIFVFVFRNGFQRLDKIKDSNRQSKQLEELTGKMRECKRCATCCASLNFCVFSGWKLYIFNIHIYIYNLRTMKIRRNRMMVHLIGTLKILVDFTVKIIYYFTRL